MDIDWETFAARVPVGTRIRYDMETGLGPLHVEGVLIERDLTESLPDYTGHKIHYPSGNVSSESYDYPADLMDYFINDHWQTFDEVMA